MSKIAMLGEIHEDGWKNLKNQNYDVCEITDFSKKNLIKELKNVNAVALRSAVLNEDVLMHCPKIKIISRHGVGYDNVDLSYLNKKKIALAVTGTSNAVSVAEHVMTMFLYLSKKINLSDNLVRNDKFTNKTSIGNFFEIYQKNILILGFGRIGQALAKRCKGFEANILIYDPFVSKELIEKNDYKKVEFDFGIKEADYITIHMPLSDQTKNLISKKEFEKMKDNAIIVNTARGGIINEKDLYWALNNKRIFGAGTDVFEIEPLPQESILWTHPNVYVTPHIASLTHPPTACRYIAGAISRHRQGEPWPHLVETGRGY